MLVTWQLSVASAKLRDCCGANSKPHECLSELASYRGRGLPHHPAVDVHVRGWSVVRATWWRPYPRCTTLSTAPDMAATDTR